MEIKLMYKVRTHHKCQCLGPIINCSAEGLQKHASFVYHLCFCRILFTCERHYILSQCAVYQLCTKWLASTHSFVQCCLPQQHSLSEHGCLEHQHMVSIVPNYTLNDTASIKCHVRNLPFHICLASLQRSKTLKLNLRYAECFSSHLALCNLILLSNHSYQNFNQNFSLC